MSIMSRLLFFLALVYTTLALTIEDVHELVSREYTNPDPANDPKNAFGYVPRISYAVIACLGFAFVAISHTYLMIRYRGVFMLAMVIAEYAFAVGVAARIPMHSDPTKLTMYILQNSFIVLSPCGFIAANYVLLGRLARWLKCNEHMLVRPERITLFFVLSDVFTFLIQGSGGGLSASAGDNPDKAKLGSKIFLVGLILQGVSFVFFTFMYLHFLYRVYTREPRIWNYDARKGWLHDWRGLAGALLISCFFILVRSGYRIAELSEGYRGPIARKENLFYLLDVLCLFIAVSVYVVFWPGRFIPNKKGMERVMTDSDGDKFNSSRIAMLAPHAQESQQYHDTPYVPYAYDHRGRPMA